MNKNQRELKAVEAELSQVGLEAKSLQDAARKEDRELTDEENTKVDSLITKSETLKGKKSEIQDRIEVEERITELGRSIASEETSEEKSASKVEVKSAGEQFVESKAYRLAATTGSLDRIGEVEVKTTLTSATGSGAGLLTPEVQPGVLPKLFERLTIADLLASGTTSSNSVTYMRETIADGSDVTAIAEGATKPEVELAFDQVNVAVKKIAAFLPVTDEMLEDASQLASYINGRLALFVKQAEENQLLNGSGSGANLKGILTQIPGEGKGVQSEAKEANMADHIFATITHVRSKFIEPSGIVVNSDDWAQLRLIKDANGNYIAGGPFSNSGPQPVEYLWNKPVVVTSAIDPGTALVGAFSTGAQVFRKTGLTVETTNSHASFFRENLTAIRAEERLALAVYRPEGFATADTGFGAS